MVNQKEIDLLVYGHIYEWVKPKVWNKNLNDIDWKDVKDTVYMDALGAKTKYWKNYAHFTEIFNDVKKDLHPEYILNGKVAIEPTPQMTFEIAENY